MISPEIFLEKLRLSKVMAKMGLKILESKDSAEQVAEYAFNHAKKVERQLKRVEINHNVNSPRPEIFNFNVSCSLLNSLTEYFEEAIKLIEAQERYINE